MSGLRVTCVALLLLAPAAGAQLTAKKASAQLKAASKQALKDAKDAYKDARDVALDSIAAYEDLLKDHGFVQNEAEDLCLSLESFVASVQGAMRGACSDCALTAVDLLGQIEDDDVDIASGVFPDDFHSGTGGALDDLHASLTKEAEKTSVQVFNRLGKTARLLDKQAAVTMTVVRRPLLPGLLDAGVLSTGVETYEDAPQISIDLAVTLSSSSVLNDGFVFLAGVGSEALTSVTVSIQNLSNVAVPDADTDRWQTSFGTELDGLDEGNYVADVIGLDGGARDTLVVAVR